MPEAPAILRLEAVTVEDGPGYDIGLRGASLTLHKGELAVVLLQRPYFNPPLADLANGLLNPESGKVCFTDRDWARILPGRAELQRGTIGRIFNGRAWVSNLDIDENILLPQRHHFQRSDAELLADATALAIQFGLTELPAGRPSQTTPRVLLRAAAVRAFLGKPQLLILERPEHGAFPELMPPLLASIDAARQRGAAVLWITNLPEVFNDPQLHPTARYRMEGPLLKPVAETSAGDAPAGELDDRPPSER